LRGARPNMALSDNGLVKALTTPYRRRERSKHSRRIFWYSALDALRCHTLRPGRDATATLLGAEAWKMKLILLCRKKKRYVERDRESNGAMT